ncbi:hypothetical protein BH23GEM10_BH23GEM10_11150 [soil metagenome]
MITIRALLLTTLLTTGCAAGSGSGMNSADATSWPEDSVVAINGTLVALGARDLERRPARLDHEGGVAARREAIDPVRRVAGLRRPHGNGRVNDTLHIEPPWRFRRVGGSGEIRSLPIAIQLSG